MGMWDSLGLAEDKLGLEKRLLRVAPRASGSCLNMATPILKTPALAAQRNIMVTSGVLNHAPFPPPQPMELRLKGRVGLTCCTHVWEEARDTLWHLIKIGLNKDKNKDQAASASHVVGL